MTITKPFLIYGATGYTGELVARAALQRGLQPVLAGRDPQKVGRLAAELGFPWRSFELNNGRALRNALTDLKLVLLLAGPYVETAQTVVEACLETGAHYLDITGELKVYEWLASQGQAARHQGVMLGTGMGFDVVPTDCLAAHLKARLPSATELTLGIANRGRVGWSHGTLRSALGQMHSGLKIRREGRLASVPWGYKERVIDFGWGPRTCGLVPWGDVVTAYYSTGIPNIEVYARLGRSVKRMVKLLNLTSRLAGEDFSRWLSQRVVPLLPAGISAEQRAKARMSAWGQVSDPQGRRITARLTTPEAYEFTAEACLQAVEKVLAGEVRPGFQTPATAFGADFVLEVAGVERQEL